MRFVRTSHHSTGLVEVPTGTQDAFLGVSAALLDLQNSLIDAKVFEHCHNSDNSNAAWTLC